MAGIKLRPFDLCGAAFNPNQRQEVGAAFPMGVSAVPSLRD